MINKKINLLNGNKLTQKNEFYAMLNNETCKLYLTNDCNCLKK